VNRRFLAILVLPIVLIAAAVLDSRRDRPVRAMVAAPVAVNGPSLTAAPERTEANAPAFGPVMAAASALDSAWFCVAGTANQGGAADATIVVVNSGSQTSHVTFNLVTDDGTKRTLPLDLAPSTRYSLHVADVIQGQWAAATVLADKGQVAAAITVANNGGVSVTPCASRASSSWYFAAGSTDAGASELFALYNPYPEDASANITLTTEDGVRQPSALQGIPVPAGSLVMVHLNDTQNRRISIAAEITAPLGRIVVSRIQSYSGQGPTGATGAAPKGLSLSLGSAFPSTSWTWPYGVKVPRVSEQYVLYNPGSDDAHVEVDISLENTGTNGRIRPIPLTVQAGTVQVFDPGTLQQLPQSVNFSTTIRSTNGKPIVVDRIAVSSTGNQGVSFAPGSALWSKRWVLPATDTRNGRAYVAVSNPGTSLATVTVRALNGPAGAAAPSFQLAPGDRHDIDLALFGAGPNPAVLVTSDQPVVAAGLEFQTGGISQAVGEPEIGSITLP
jgi:hypothetical protein